MLLRARKQLQAPPPQLAPDAVKAEGKAGTFLPPGVLVPSLLTRPGLKRPATSICASGCLLPLPHVGLCVTAADGPVPPSIKRAHKCGRTPRVQRRHASQSLARLRTGSPRRDGTVTIAPMTLPTRRSPTTPRAPPTRRRFRRSPLPMLWQARRTRCRHEAMHAAPTSVGAHYLPTFLRGYRFWTRKSCHRPEEHRLALAQRKGAAL